MSYSIIIPVYNEEQFLPDTLTALDDAMSEIGETVAERTSLRRNVRSTPPCCRTVMLVAVSDVIDPRNVSPVFVVTTVASKPEAISRFGTTM